jgi:hypothetical protein
MEQYISIEKAQYVNDYKIAFRFNGGKESILDFQNFITQFQHPDIRKYKDINLFKKFSLVYGDIEWNDYDLYEGSIE